MENVNRFLELDDLHRSICAARIVGAHLPDCLAKTAQDFGALVLLPDLCLAQRETELVANLAWALAMR